MNKPNAASLNVRAVTRALTILQSFANAPQQSLAEVTAVTGLDKGTTRRLLLTLVDSGFIAIEPATQHYRLGGAIRELAANVADASDLQSLARPELSKLAADLQMTAFLSIYTDGHAVCLDRLHDIKGIEVKWWSIGGSQPYNCGAAPKLLLAYQARDEIERMLARPATAMTPKSIIDPATLKSQLARIRKRGWDFAADDVVHGLAAIAAPVFYKSGQLACAISIAGLTPQIAMRGKPAHLDRVLEAAAAIQRRLHSATI